MAIAKLNCLFSCNLQTPNLPTTTKNWASPQLALLPLKNPSLKIQIFPPKPPLKTTIIREEEERASHLSVGFPCLAFSNTLFFNSPYNVQVVVSEKESEEALVDRFRRQVLRSGVLRETKRRMSFENNQAKRKRKTRDALRRYRKWRPPPKVSKQGKAPETSKKTNQDSDDDNWEFLDVDLPYC